MESTWIEITFVVEPDDYRLLKKHAEGLDLTIPGLLRRNIADFLRKQDEMSSRGMERLR